jgi:hypothetical protein
MALLASISLALLVSTRYPDWGREPYQTRVASVDMGWVRPNSLVVLVGAPIAYVAAFTPARDRAAFVGLTDATFESRGYRLADEIMRRIRNHRGPIWIVWNSDDGWRLPSLHDMGLVQVPDSCQTFASSYELATPKGLHACAANTEVQPMLKNPFWLRAAQRYDEIVVPEPTPGWSYAAFVRSVGSAARNKRYVDQFEYLWSRQPDRPQQFDDKILPHTLYILDPTLKDRAARVMNKSSDLLSTIDGVLVLAPGWRRPAAVN